MTLRRLRQDFCDLTLKLLSYWQEYISELFLHTYPNLRMPRHQEALADRQGLDALEPDNY
jgi:hypothetical protein